MSTNPTSASPTPGRKGLHWLGIIALVLVCTIVGSLGGALTGGVAGYLLGQRAARSEVARVGRAAGPEARRDVQPQPIVPPREWRFEWPNEGNVPSVAVYAEVASVVEGSPAEKAGVQAGDDITHVDGEELTFQRDLAKVISSHKVGDEVELTIERDGEEKRIIVTLGENPDNPNSPYLGLTYRMVGGIGSRYPSS